MQNHKQQQLGIQIPMMKNCDGEIKTQLDDLEEEELYLKLRMIELRKRRLSSCSADSRTFLQTSIQAWDNPGSEFLAPQFNSGLRTVSAPSTPRKLEGNRYNQHLGTVTPIWTETSSQKPLIVQQLYSTPQEPNFSPSAGFQVIEQDEPFAKYETYESSTRQQVSYTQYLFHSALWLPQQTFTSSTQQRYDNVDVPTQLQDSYPGHLEADTLDQQIRPRPPIIHKHDDMSENCHLDFMLDSPKSSASDTTALAVASDQDYSVEPLVASPGAEHRAEGPGYEFLACESIADTDWEEMSHSNSTQVGPPPCADLRHESRQKYSHVTKAPAHMVYLQSRHQVTSSSPDSVDKISGEAPYQVSEGNVRIYNYPKIQEDINIPNQESAQIRHSVTESSRTVETSEVISNYEIGQDLKLEYFIRTDDAEFSRFSSLEPKSLSVASEVGQKGPQFNQADTTFSDQGGYPADREAKTLGNFDKGETCNCGKSQPGKDECYFCWPCNGTVFCKECWDACPPHRGGLLGSQQVGFLHEKSDPVVARSIFETLQSEINADQQARQNRKSASAVDTQRQGLFTGVRALYKTAVDNISTNLNAERLWTDFLSNGQMPENLRDRFVRPNSRLQSDPPRMDELLQLAEFEEKTHSPFTKDVAIVKAIADRLIARMFYFAMDQEQVLFSPDEADPGYRTVTGRIQCRMVPHSPELKFLGEALRRRAKDACRQLLGTHSPYFVVYEHRDGVEKSVQHVLEPHVVDQMCNEGVFAMEQIKITLTSRHAETEMFLCLADQPQDTILYPISGFPRILVKDLSKGPKFERDGSSHVVKTSRYKPDWAEFERKCAGWAFPVAQYRDIRNPFQHFASSENVTPGNVAIDSLEFLKLGSENEANSQAACNHQNGFPWRTKLRIRLKSSDDSERSLEKNLWPLTAEKLGLYDMNDDNSVEAYVVEPPRQGATEQAIHTIYELDSDSRVNRISAQITADRTEQEERADEIPKSRDRSSYSGLRDTPEARNSRSTITIPYLPVVQIPPKDLPVSTPVQLSAARPLTKEQRIPARDTLSSAVPTSENGSQIDNSAVARVPRNQSGAPILAISSITTTSPPDRSVSHTAPPLTHRFSWESLESISHLL